MADRDTESIDRFRNLHHPRYVLAKMTEAEYRARVSELEVYELGHRARELGVSWREIAESIGVTQQAAHSRWSRPREESKLIHQREVVELLRSRVSSHVALNDVPYEYERRFLLADQSVLRSAVKCYRIEQAYVWRDAEGGVAIRVRRMSEPANGPEGQAQELRSTLTIKGPRNREGARAEIATDVADVLVDVVLRSAEHTIEKDRYLVRDDDRTFEIDIFKGENQGLMIAEFEGSAEEVATLRPPDWCGPEITHDDRYNNEALAYRPYPQWPA